MATKNRQLVLENFHGLTKDWVIKGGEDYKNKKGPIDKFVRAQTVYPLFVAGELMPGYQTKTITNSSVVSTDITDMAIDSLTVTGAPIAYGIGDNILYKITTTTTAFDTVVNNTPATPTWPHTISGAVTTAGQLHDCLTCYVNIAGTQTYCLLYSTNTNVSGTGQLGLYDITNNDDWGGGGNSNDAAYALSTNPIPTAGSAANLTPRPMTLGTNGIVYIGSGYVVDSLDTTVSSATIVLNAIDIPQNYEIQTLSMYKGFLVIGAQQKSTTATRQGGTAVFFWDTFSQSFIDPVFIDDSTCGTLYNDGMNLWLFTANGLYGNIRQWDGQQFIIQQQTTVNIPKHNNITPLRNGFAYGGASFVFWYGEVVPGEGYTLWNLYNVGSAVTCVKKLNPTNDILHFGGDTSNTEFLRTTDTAKFETATLTWPTVNLGRRVTIYRIVVYYATLATGAAVTLEYWKNLGGSLNTPYGTITFAADGTTKNYKVFNTKITDINTFNMQLTWDAIDPANQVCIERIEIDYSEEDTKLTS